MFDKTKYVIETSITERLRALRETYGVKDANGNLLGYIKEERLGINCWFEGMDGTRLGEIRVADGYEVYDAQNMLRGIIKREKPRGLFSKPSWLIEDHEGHLLAEAKEIGRFVAKYQILAPDGGVFAEINPIVRIPFLPGGSSPSFRIDVTRQGLDPILILSYAYVLVRQRKMMQTAS